MESILDIANMFRGLVSDSDNDNDKDYTKLNLSRLEFDELRKLVKPGDLIGSSKLLIEKGIRSGLMCWDWVYLCYYIGQCKIESDEFSSHSNYEGRDCRSRYAKIDKLKLIKAGTWLYINNHNSSDVHGNHSVIALSDYNGDNIKVASLWQPHQVGREHTINPLLDGQRVVYIGAPGVVDIGDNFFNLRSKYIEWK